jgi:phospholipid N-methyltransferase
MESTDKVFAGGIPELYERLLVPLVFAEYARDLADRVATSEPLDVLEVAAGIGALTRAIASRLGPDARIVASDLNQPHGHHDREVIRAELKTAGFTTIDVETVEKTSKASSARDVAIAYCQGTPFRNEIQARAPLDLVSVTEKVEEVLARRFGSGAVEGKIKAHVVAAVP